MIPKIFPFEHVKTSNLSHLPHANMDMHEFSREQSMNKYIFSIYKENMHWLLTHTFGSSL